MENREETVFHFQKKQLLFGHKCLIKNTYSHNTEKIIVNFLLKKLSIVTKKGIQRLKSVINILINSL